MNCIIHSLSKLGLEERGEGGLTVLSKLYQEPVPFL